MRLFLILSLLSLRLISQKEIEPEKIKAFSITVNYDTYTVKTQMLKDQKKITVDNDLTYLWFNAHNILETKGGFDGKLIHGYYKSFYMNNQLRESGEVKYGLKHNIWKNWYPDGKLKEVVTYKKGRKNGHYELYNDLGELMASGCFKRDLLHGKFYTYNTQRNVTATTRYKNGREVLPQQKTPKMKDTESDNKKEENNNPNKEVKPTKDRDSNSNSVWRRLKKIFRKKDKKPIDSNITEKPKPSGRHA